MKTRKCGRLATMGENTGWSGARVARDITEIVAITLFCGTLVMWCMVLTGGM